MCRTSQEKAQPPARTSPRYRPERRGVLADLLTIPSPHICRLVRGLAVACEDIIMLPHPTPPHPPLKLHLLTPSG